METPEADINRISEAFGECARDLVTFCSDAGNLELESGNDPEVIIDAMVNLLNMLYAHEAMDAKLSADELSELGNYGLNMLQALALDSEGIGYSNHFHFEDIAFPLALWLARADAELDVLDPVVNTLARLANKLTHPDELENLFSQSSEIADAVSVVLTQDLEQSEPGAAWSVFLLNRGIIATRTLNPECIESAYGAIVEYLPDVSHEFFAEGMEQMELLDYPPLIRAIVERYFNESKAKNLLH